MERYNHYTKRKRNCFFHKTTQCGMKGNCLHVGNEKGNCYKVRQCDLFRPLWTPKEGEDALYGIRVSGGRWNTGSRINSLERSPHE